jgi:phage/plasmid-like protein (TIGR03299 family)
MPANVQTMAYYGEVPWHGLGTAVPQWVSAKEMIYAAGMDWQVKLKPARGAQRINRKGEHSRYEVLREARPQSGEEDVLLGLVSRRYQPLQNVDAFEFFDPIVRDKEAYFETAGVLEQGERIWVMARMPEAMEVVRGDDCFNYLLLSNTHTGEGAVIVKFTSVRVVCQNTLMMAMEDGQKAYRVRHTKKMQLKLDELSSFLAITQKVFLKSREVFCNMAKVEMTQLRLDRYFEAVFPRTKAQKKANVRPVRWGWLQEIFEATPDLQLPGVQGTMWAAYNAITRFEDYKKPQQEEQPDQHLERIWFGGGADIKLAALAQASELTAMWR